MVRVLNEECFDKQIMSVYIVVHVVLVYEVSLFFLQMKYTHQVHVLKTLKSYLNGQ